MLDESDPTEFIRKSPENGSKNIPPKVTIIKGDDMLSKSEVKHVFTGTVCLLVFVAGVSCLLSGSLYWSAGAWGKDSTTGICTMLELQNVTICSLGNCDTLVMWLVDWNTSNSFLSGALASSDIDRTVYKVNTTCNCFHVGSTFSLSLSDWTTNMDPDLVIYLDSSNVGVSYLKRQWGLLMILGIVLFLIATIGPVIALACYLVKHRNDDLL